MPVSRLQRPQKGSVLSAEEELAVARYWLAALRFEEALAARPRARRPAAVEGPEALPNLSAPTAGQQYAKLPYSESACWLVEQGGECELPLAGDALAYFEDWLYQAYRAGDHGDDVPPDPLVALPALLTPRGELAGLLRVSTRLCFVTHTGATFVVPKSRERQAGAFAEPPTALRLECAERSAESLPWLIDTQILGQVLRVPIEHVEALFKALRGKASITSRQVISALCQVLDAPLQAGPPPSLSLESLDGSPAEVLQRLQRSTQARLRKLSARTVAYPVALIVGGEPARTTRHVQRDLRHIAELINRRALDKEHPLSGYLRGREKAAARPQPRTQVRARFSQYALTPSQSDAASWALSRRLSAIQGPPGTGKTTLIHNLLAEQLLRKVEPLLAGYRMGEHITVVTSTNHAAIDNALDPWLDSAYGTGLPLGLRAGSREVTERVTVPLLEQTRQWLLKPHPADPKRQLAQALAGLQQALDQQSAKGLVSPDQGREPALLVCAIEVREAWARVHQDDLLNVVGQALATASKSRALSRLMSGSGPRPRWLKRLFPVWGSTLLSLGNVFPAEPGCVAEVIIDEAGQCHPAYAASGLLRAESALVIGDTMQLEPVATLSEEDDARLLARLGLSDAADSYLRPYRMFSQSGASAQALADASVERRPVLTEHFRCQKPIAAICESLCEYGLEARTAPASQQTQVAELCAPVLFLPVEGQQARSGGSWFNAREIEHAVAWVQHFQQCGVPLEEIGVITPFRGQLEALTQALRRAQVQLSAPSQYAHEAPSLFGPPDRGLAVGTVHRFQGGERSIIVLTTTITQKDSLRFVDERVNLLNVAASRAREHLLTIGHEPTLAAGAHTPLLLRDAVRVLPLPRDPGQ